MKIGTNWKIESDSLNITLYKKHLSRNKRVYWSAEGFFSSTKSALKHLADAKVAETKLVDLKTVVEKQDEIYELISSLKV